MKIQLKINTANGTLDSVLIPDNGVITVKQPDGKVSFELIDLDTGLAPQSIVAKRVGDNLEIAFENAETPSLVIQGYYKNEELSPLVGLAEDGKYYTYIPASGVNGDSIPLLKDNILATEVLGGEVSAPIPFFATWPWLVGGLVAALLDASVSSSHKPYQPVDEADKPVVEAKQGSDYIVTPKSGADKQTISYTKPDGETETFVVQRDPETGNWTPASNENGEPSNLPAGVTLTPETGVVIIPAANVKEGTEITAENSTVQKVPQEVYTVTPGEDNIAQTISYTAPNGDKVEFRLEKNPTTGKWEAKGNLPAGVTFDPDTGIVTILASNVKEGAKILAQGENASGSKAEGELDYPDPPSVETEGTLIVVKPGEDNIKQKISYITPNDENVTFTVEKVDGKWVAKDGLPAGVTLDPVTGYVSIPAANVKKDSLVTASGSNEAHPDKVVEAVLDPADAPIVISKETIDHTRVIEVHPGEDNIKQMIRYTDQYDNQIEIVVEKNAQGEWVSKGELPKRVTLNPKTGVVTIPVAVIKEGTEVTAQGVNAEGNVANIAPVEKEIPQVNKVIQVFPGEDNIKQDISYTDKDGNKVTFTVEKVPDPTDPTNPDKGIWVAKGELPKGVIVDPSTGVVSIPAENVKEGTEVTSVGTNKKGSEADGTLDEADKPDVTPNQDNEGNSVVVVTPGADNDRQEITYTKPDGTTEHIRLQVEPGSDPKKWVVVDETGNPRELPAGVTLDPATGVVTIPAENIKKGTQVVAIGENSKGSSSTGDAVTDNNADKPNVDSKPNDQGNPVVTVAPGKDNIKQEISYTDKNNQPVTIVLEKNSTGRWEPKGELPAGVSYDPVTGVVTIPAENIKKGTEVTAIGTNDTGASADGSGATHNPADAPNVENASRPEDNKPVINVKPGADNTKQTITYTKPDGSEEVIRIKLDPATNQWSPVDANGNPTELPAGVTLDPATGLVSIPAENVKEGTQVTASGENASGNSADNSATAPDDADKPTVTPSDTGSVSVEPGKDNVENTVTYTKPDGTVETITIKRDPETNTWGPKGEVPPGVSIDPDTGVVTVRPTEGSTTHNVDYTDANGNKQTIRLEKDPNGTWRVVGELPPNAQLDPATGVVTITPPEGTTFHDLSYTKPNGEVATVRIEKDATGKWKPKGVLPEGVRLDPETGVLTIEAGKVKEGSEVNAVGTNESGNKAQGAGTSTDRADAPRVENNITNGGELAVTVTPGEDNVAQNISYVTPTDKRETFRVEKNPETNTWAIVGEAPAGVTVNPNTGVVTIPLSNIKEGSQVEAVGTNAAGNQATGELTTQDFADKPNVETKDDGSITVRPGEDNTEEEISYTNSNGETENVSIVKDPETGLWEPKGTLPTDVTLDPNTGAVTYTPPAGTETHDVTYTDHNGDKNTITFEKDRETNKWKPRGELPANVTFDPETGRVTVTPPEGSDTEEVDYIKQDGTIEKVRIYKDPNTGKWKPKGTLPDGLELDPVTGVLIIPSSNLKDGTNIRAVGTNTTGNKAKDEGTATDNADKPEITPESTPIGEVIRVTPGQDNTKQDISYTTPTDERVDFSVRKNPETGKWEPVGNLPDGVKLDQDTGVVTIPKRNVKPGTEVTAIGTNATGNSATDTLDQADKPNVTPSRTDDGEEVVRVTPGEDNTKQDISYTKPDGETERFTVEKDPTTGEWKAKGDLPAGVSVDPATGVVTIPTRNIKEGTPVTAVGSNSSGDNAQDSLDEADKPTVSTSANGDSVKVTPGEDNNKQDITYTKPDGTTETFTVEKDPETGIWKPKGELPAGVTVDPATGVVTIPTTNLKEGEPVTAVGSNPSGNSSTGKLDEADKPTVTPESTPTGDVVRVTPGADNNKQEITYTKPNGETETIVVEKDPNGVWKPKGELPAGVSVDPNTGVVTIPSTNLKEGSPVTAVGSNPEGSKAEDTLDKADKPTVEAGTNATGQPVVNVTPGEDNTKQDISYTKPNGDKENFTVEKDPVSGEWRPKGELPEGVSVDPTTGVVTIPTTNIKEGTPVNVTGTNAAGNSADGVLDEADKPVVTLDKQTDSENPVVKVTPGEDNIAQDISYPNPKGEKVTIRAEKDPNTGEWSLKGNVPEGVTIDPRTGVVSIPTSGIQKGAVVTAVGTNPTGNKAEGELSSDAEGIVDKPFIDPIDDGSVEVTPGKDNVRLKVVYENNNQDNITLETRKDQQTGLWSVKDNAPLPEGVSLNPQTGVVTIAPDAVRDISIVIATGIDAENNSIAATDYSKPDLPTAKPAPITAYNDDVGTIQNPTNTSPVTDDRRPAFVVGTGLENKNPKLFVNGKVVPATYDPATGTLTPTDPNYQLPEGRNEIAYSIREPGKKESPRSEPFVLEVDVTPPQTLSFTANPDGSVAVNLPENAREGDKAIVNVRQPGQAQDTPVEFVKQADGSWKSNNPALIPSTQAGPNANRTTIAERDVEDNSQVTGKGTDKAGNELAAEPKTALPPAATDKPAKPESYKDDVGRDMADESREPKTDDNRPGIKIGPNLQDKKPKLIVDDKEVDATYDPVTGTLTPNAPLEDGLHNFKYTLEEPGKPRSEPSDPLPITIDTTPPAAPVFTAGQPSAGALTVTLPDPNDVNTEVGSKVTLTIPAQDRDGAENVVVFKKGENGWMLESATRPDDIQYTAGENTVVIPADKVHDVRPVTGVSEDPLGNRSESEGVAGSLDQTPQPPAPLSYKDNVVPVEDNTRTKAATNDDTPGLNIGAGKEGQTPKLYVDGVLTPATYDNVAGTLTPDSPLPEKDTPYDFSYSLTDPGKTESPRSNGLPILIDKTAPSPVEFVTGQPYQGALTVNLPADAKIGDVVEFKVPAHGATASDEPQKVVLTKQPNGNWVVTEGDSTVVVPAASGNTAVIPADKVSDDIPVKAIAKDEADNQSEERSQVAGPLAKTPTPAAESYQDNQGSIQSPTSTAPQTDDTTPGLNIGRDKADLDPKLYVDGNLVPSKYDPATGTLTPTTPLAQGPHTLQYTLQEPNKTVSDKSAPVSVEVDTTAPDAPTFTPAQPYQGALTVNLPTRNVKVGDTVELDVPAQGARAGDTPQKVILTKTATGWDVTSDPANVITKGTDPNKVIIAADKVADNLDVTGIAKDPAGNTSRPNTGRAGPLATTATPRLDNYNDDVGLYKKNPSTDRITDDNRPGFNIGTGKANLDPKLYVNGKLVDATYDPNKGTLTPNQPLAEGNNTITYTLQEPNKLVSAQSNPLTLEVDTTPPSPPTLTPNQPHAGALTVGLPRDAKPNDFVEIEVPPQTGTGVNKVVLTKQPNGTWAITSDPGKVIPAGTVIRDNFTIAADKVSDTREVVARSKDPVGNISNDVSERAGGLERTPKPVATTYKDDVAPHVEAERSRPRTNDDKPGLNIGRNKGNLNPKLFVDGKFVESDYNPEDGTLTPRVPLTEGPHGLRYTLKEPNKSESERSDPVIVLIDKTAPNMPDVNAQTTDGSVRIALPTNAEPTDKVEVKFVRTGQTAETTVTLTKLQDGTWKSDNTALIPSTRSGADVNNVVIAEATVEDGTLVKAKAYDVAGNESRQDQDTAKDVTAPDKPRIHATTTDGSVGINLPTRNVKEGDKVVVTFRETGRTTDTVVTLTKQGDRWISDKPNLIASTAARGNRAVILERTVEDDSVVKAYAVDPSGNRSAEDSGRAKDVTAPDAPRVTANNDGSVSIGLPTNNVRVGDTVTVNVTKTGQSSPSTVTLTKTANGWTSSEPAVVVPPTGNSNEARIPENKVEDLTRVTARAQDPAGNRSAENSAEAKDVTPPNTPTVTANNNGSVTIGLPNNAKVGDTVTVNVVKQGETRPTPITLTKTATGWDSSDNSVVPPVRGSGLTTTIPENKVEDLSEVTANSRDRFGNTTNQTNRATAKDVTAPKGVALTAENDGSISIALPTQDVKVGDKVIVNMTKTGANAETPVTLVKKANGWELDAGQPRDVITNINGNTAKIAAPVVKDGSEVRAKAIDPSGNFTDAQPVRAAHEVRLDPLSIRLEEDTIGRDKQSSYGNNWVTAGASNTPQTDSITKNGNVIVSGVPQGFNWEYSLDGGRTWLAGTGNKFTLDGSQGGPTGTSYNVMARVVGVDSTRSNVLNTVVDTVAPVAAPYMQGKALKGITEPFAVVTISEEIPTRRGRKVVNVDNKIRVVKADANGYYTIDNLPTARVPELKVVVRDAAGNVSTSKMKRISLDSAYDMGTAGGGSNQGTIDQMINNNNRGDQLVIIDGANQGGAPNRAKGSIWGSTRGGVTIDTGDGNDSIYVDKGFVEAGTVKMGNGDDVFVVNESVRGSAGKGSSKILMGNGNDIVEIRDVWGPVAKASIYGDVDVDLGAGDDTLILKGGITDQADVRGGDGYDTLKLSGSGGKLTVDAEGISGFEVIDLTGTGNNTLRFESGRLASTFLSKNGANIVGDDGTLHHGVTIVKGDAGDRVENIGTTVAGHVQYQGQTYTVFHYQGWGGTGLRQLWVDSDITML